MEEFDTFWTAYPLKTGKGHARKAFERAMKKTTLEEILRGIELYKKHKPDWKAFKHPSTWLNGECWADEYPAEHTNGALVLTQTQISNWKHRIAIGIPVPRDMIPILRANGVQI